MSAEGEATGTTDSVGTPTRSASGQRRLSALMHTLYVRHGGMTATASLRYLERALEHLGLDLDSPSLTAADEAEVLDLAHGLSTGSVHLDG